MLNSQTLPSRQTQPSRRVVGVALMPTLVRLAECADTDIATTAKAVVMALYGARGGFVLRAGLASLTSEELATALDVLSTRDVPDITAYLRRYFGPGPVTRTTVRRVLQLVQDDMPQRVIGLDALTQVRDMEQHTPMGIMASRLLKLDLLGRLSESARSYLSMLPRDAIRGMLAEFAQHDLDEMTLVRLVESVCS